MISIQLLLIFMIIAAVIALQIRDLLSAVVAVGFVGLGLSICFLLLKAPDLAIVQLVVEILVLVILIRLTVSKDHIARYRTDYVLGVSVIIFIALFLGVSYFALKYIPPFGCPLMNLSDIYISQGLNMTGAANLVSSIALGFRAYDSLGGIVVLFTATIAVIALMRSSGRRKP
jgi:multisubunit Na+/H+ antiporter MnhB subunit